MARDSKTSRQLQTACGVGLGIMCVCSVGCGIAGIFVPPDTESTLAAVSALLALAEAMALVFAFFTYMATRRAIGRQQGRLDDLLDEVKTEDERAEKRAEKRRVAAKRRSDELKEAKEKQQRLVDSFLAQAAAAEKNPLPDSQKAGRPPRGSSQERKTARKEKERPAYAASASLILQWKQAIMAEMQMCILFTTEKKGISYP